MQRHVGRLSRAVSTNQVEAAYRMTQDTRPAFLEGGANAKLPRPQPCNSIQVPWSAAVLWDEPGEFLSRCQRSSHHARSRAGHEEKAMGSAVHVPPHFSESR